MPDDTQELIALTAEIVAAHVGHNDVPVADLPALIRTVHDALVATGAPALEQQPAKPIGAVSVRASVKPDRLLSMIDGKPYKILGRHLRRHGYTPDSYREAFDLPRDYPMVAAEYAGLRREHAVRIGLGRKPRRETAEPEVANDDTLAPDDAGTDIVSADMQENGSVSQPVDNATEPKGARRRLGLRTSP